MKNQLILIAAFTGLVCLANAQTNVTISGVTYSGGGGLLSPRGQRSERVGDWQEGQILPKNTWLGLEPDGRIYFLVGYPNTNTVVTGDGVDCFVYEDGIYTYNSTAGTLKTLRKYRYLDGVEKKVVNKPRKIEPVLVCGNVLAVLPDGILVKMMGLIKFVVGHPRQKSIVDDDLVCCCVYEDGIYTYNSTDGATMTVRKYRYFGERGSLSLPGCTF